MVLPLRIGRMSDGISPRRSKGRQVLSWERRDESVWPYRAPLNRWQYEGISVSGFKPYSLNVLSLNLEVLILKNDAILAKQRVDLIFINIVRIIIFL